MKRFCIPNYDSKSGGRRREKKIDGSATVSDGAPNTDHLAEIDRVVGDHLEADPALHAVLSAASAAVEAVGRESE